MTQKQTHRFCIAPMMDWTDRHCRFFHRILTRRARLYTEMVTADAVVFGTRERLIGFDDFEQPLALQLGGANPARLAQAAAIAADFGYSEINLNCGCPSDRVQSGRFGACLMREPALVAEGVAAMKASAGIPVSVKCRIGVDEQEPREALFAFVAAVKAAGAEAVIVHARKAWLDGLSPRENRDIPPLDYAIVKEVKRAHPYLTIVINGGLGDLAVAAELLRDVDGVMIGRAAYQSPDILLDVDPVLFGEPAPVADAFEALEVYQPYVERQLAEGARLHDMTRHLLGLFAGRRGARGYRQTLASLATRQGAGIDVLERAVANVASAPTLPPPAAPGAIAVRAEHPLEFSRG